MIIKQCDICGKIDTTMIEFVIPKYAHERINTCSKNGWEYKLQEGIYPISSHICSKCQDKMKSIATNINYL